MSAHTVYLDFVESWVRLNVPDRQLLERLQSMVAPLTIATPSEPDRSVYQIDIQYSPPHTIPDAADQITETELEYAGHCRMAATENYLWQVFPGRASLKIERGKKRSEIYAAKEHISLALETCLMLALEDMIDLSGQFILHAASLRVPGGKGNILIYAPSGVGKTTTTLSLLHAGFGLCSDDGTILKNHDGNTRGWGLPRDMKVHKNTVALLPWLAPYFSDQWNEEGEQPFTRDTLSGLFPIFDKDPQPILCVFALKRSDQNRCAATPLAPIEAAIGLTADNVRVSQHGLLPGQNRRFDALLDMVTTVPVYQLEAGSDLEAVAPVVNQVLERIE